MAKNPNAKKIKEIEAATAVLYKEFKHLERVQVRLRNRGEIFETQKVQRRLDELTDDMFNLDNEIWALKND